MLVSVLVSISLVLSIAVFIKYIVRSHLQSGKSMKLRYKANKKKEKELKYNENQLEQLSKELNKETVEYITDMNGPEIVENGKLKKLNPCLTTKAYLYKGLKVTKNFNCITEVLKDCMTTAENLDDKEVDKLPLYGLPVTVKECFQTKGLSSNLGTANLLDDIAEKDCVLVEVLKHCGAIPFAKTNIPPLMLSFEASNPIYGRTLNPHNPTFGPGGSSSGEGSIIGARGSVLGFGTDTGGSIRVPSHLCGICGFKPSMNRLSQSGVKGENPMIPLATSAGPMARDVDTIVMAMKALCCEKMLELDPYVMPIKFRDEIYHNKKPIRIGYFDDNGYMKPIPACQRAIRITKEALENAGHTLIPYNIPDIDSIIDFCSAGFADGGKSFLEALKDDVVDDSVKLYHDIWTTPWIFRKFYAFFLKIMYPRMAKNYVGYSGKENRSTYNLWKTGERIEEYKTKFWNEWREKYKIDALICPVFPLAACPTGSLKNLTALGCYTVVFNIVNGPAGTVPVTRVTQKDIDDLQSYKDHYDDELGRLLKNACTESIGMPVGVQCASYPFKEEVCLRLMKEVETLLPMKK